MYKFLLHLIIIFVALVNLNAQEEIDLNSFLDFIISDKQTCILDARDKKSYKLAHFKDAIHIPDSKALNTIIKNIDFDTYLLIYCTNYSWCLSVSDLCFDYGFTKIYYLYEPIENVVNYFPMDYYYSSKKYKRNSD